MAKSNDPRTEPELPDGYYLDNFNSLLDTVCRLYNDLLTPEELAFYSSFKDLPDDAARLYVRLISRVGPGFRVQRLVYADISDVDQAVQDLLDSKFLASEDRLTPGEMNRLFRKDEIASAFGGLIPDLPRNIRKSELVEHVVGLDLTEVQLLECVTSDSSDVVVSPLHTEVLLVLRLLFFGNAYQNLTEFVLNDLGVMRYFPYQLDKEHRLFPDRASLEEYLALLQCRDQYDLAMESDDRAAVCALARDLAQGHKDSRIATRWYRLNTRLARQLERWQEFELALDLYAVTVAHPARERSARIHYQCGNFVSAGDMCDVISSAPICEAEKDFALRFRPRIQRKLKIPVDAVAPDCFAEQRLSLQHHEGGVEAAMVAHYNSGGTSAFFVENGLINGLFGLAFWQQIFASIPGAFVNPFQIRPLDMNSPEFYQRRRVVVEQRMEELRETGLQELKNVYIELHGYSNAWVNWGLLTKSLLDLAIARIPYEHLEMIWRRILFDPAANRSGLPDLVLFPSAGSYRLLEVKGPGDSLQDNQKRWLRFFQEHSVPAEVAYVDWQ